MQVSLTLSTSKILQYLHYNRPPATRCYHCSTRSQSDDTTQYPTRLFAGGKQKGLDYTELLPRLESSAKGVVVFGEIAQQLYDTFQSLSDTVTAEMATSLEDAVSQARDMAEHGDTILFSPGTSSFDMFSGYEERGDCFRRIVNNMK